MLLIRLFASVNVKAVASAVISPPKVGTAPLSSSLDCTFKATMWFNKTASTVSVSKSVRAVIFNSVNKFTNASLVGANTVNGPAVPSETVDM